ncbi:MAG: periplasmic heavy metal sensor [Nitrospirota bacterium]|nr:periplasmic heavy metal sensor [Nitrospirota bacterium]
MKNPRISRVFLSIMFVAGTLIPIGMVVADENRKHGKEHSSYESKHKMGHPDGMRRHHKSVSPLAMKEELGLTEKQVKTLQPLESDYRKASIKNRADFKIAMIDLSTLLDEKSTNKSAITKQVDEIGTIQKSMMMYRVNTMLKLKEVLTSAQYEKFRAVIKDHMEHRMGGMKHDMRGKRHYKHEGKHGKGHGEVGDHDD